METILFVGLISFTVADVGIGIMPTYMHVGFLFITAVAGVTIAAAISEILTFQTATLWFLSKWVVSLQNIQVFKMADICL